MFHVIFKKSKQLKKDRELFDKNLKDKEKIKNILQEFSINPKSSKWNLKKMEPKEENVFRLKQGKLHIIFDIDFGNKIILVYRMGYRKDVYE